MERTSYPFAAASPLQESLRIPRPRSPWTAGILGWLVPGLGQAYAGRPDKALVMFVAIGGLYVWGLALTGYSCVNPDEYGLEFVAHVLVGGPTALTLQLTRDVQVETFLQFFDVGRLYVAVAGLLNVVAVSDALSDVLVHNQRVVDMHALDRARKQAALQRLGEAALAESAWASATASIAAARPEAPPEPAPEPAPETEDETTGGGPDGERNE